VTDAGGAGRPAFRDVMVVGGGCYGTFYARQLESAVARGKLVIRQVVLVDRDPACQAARELAPRSDRSLVVADWSAFLDDFLARPAPPAGEPDDAIVPSPLMPHLMAQWLERAARRRYPDRAVSTGRLPVPLGTPYDTEAPDGTRYVSYADWLCPTHCLEPATCPVIRGPRTWEMSEAVTHYVARLAAGARVLGPALFVTRHRAFGVGMFDAAEARAARRLVAALGDDPAPGSLVVGTISSCHGALGALELDARPRASSG